MSKRLQFVAYRDPDTGDIAAKLKSGDDIPVVSESKKWRLTHIRDYLRLQLSTHEYWVLYLHKTHIIFPNMGLNAEDIVIFADVMKKVFGRCIVDSDCYRLERDMADL